ncbi:hypothetical protein GW17_00051539 [Ensete ventricosum]|nr:hypothetical protein GW17_00051539 [Ensete ventricosum]
MMLPPRFPNSAIKTKAARKGGGRSWLGPLQGRRATTRPFARAVDCAQGPCRGSRTRPGQPARVVVGAAPARDQPVEGRRPQRHHLRAWRLPVREVLLEGNSACHRGGHQRRDATAYAGVTTEGKGQQVLGFLFSSKGLFCPLNLRNFRSVILSRIS